MGKTLNRLLSLILALIMALSMVPVQALAAEEAVAVSENTKSAYSNVVKIKSK